MNLSYYEKKYQTATKDYQKNNSSENQQNLRKAGKELSSYKAIRNILENKNDYYKMFEVLKDAPVDQIKKVYRKYVRLVHPDFCKQEYASDAFKILQKAMETLEDDEKRRNYDFQKDNNNVFNQRDVNDLFRQNFSRTHPFNEFEQFFGTENRMRFSRPNFRSSISFNGRQVYNEPGDILYDLFDIINNPQSPETSESRRRRRQQNNVDSRNDFVILILVFVALLFLKIILSIF